MQSENKWENFFATGKIEDYLEYKSSISHEKEANAIEPYNNRRPDNQGTEGWRS